MGSFINNFNCGYGDTKYMHCLFSFQELAIYVEKRWLAQLKHDSSLHLLLNNGAGWLRDQWNCPNDWAETTDEDSSKEEDDNGEYHIFRFIGNYLHSTSPPDSFAVLKKKQLRYGCGDVAIMKL